MHVSLGVVMKATSCACNVCMYKVFRILWVTGVMYVHIRRPGSCCKPAFTVAAACSEMEAERGEGEGDSPRMEASPPAPAAAAPIFMLPFAVARRGTATGDEGGSEFKSGAMSVRVQFQPSSTTRATGS